jgi:pSer/pThr/pTyr-binding forkhead associated (FHA) protein
MPQLILMTAQGETTQHSVDEAETKIGRAQGNDVVVDSQRASRFHAVLSREGPFVVLRDLGSHNGTQVNGSRVEVQTLANGDMIDIGGVQMRFLTTDQELAPAEALRLMTIPGLLIDLDRR